MNNKKCYITTPIYYPNAKPHVGTLYSTLIADVVARWHRLMGEDVRFVTGTDEHGQKIQEKAESLGLAPQAFVDSIVPAFKDMWNKYEISFDTFIRTTDTAHEQAVTAWIKKLQEQGDIYKSTYSGWYCVPCETFVNVGSDPIKNEQGQYLCPTCNRSLKEIEEESYFFRLSAYEDKLLKFYEEHPDFVTPRERLHEVVAFVKAGLKDLSISRKTVSWGIPFPGDPSHTVYVWADALNNYLSAVGYGQTSPEAQAEFAKWWPADVQVMAKDIVRFHAIYWPAFLMAAGLPLPKKLLVHGYVLTGQQKMSKSLGNAYDPGQLAEWYGVEQVRYYLMRQIPISQDGHFDLKDLEERINADLANNLGNLLNRTLTLALNNGLSTVNSPATYEATSAALRERCEEAYRLYWEEMNKGYFHIGLAGLWQFISEVNAYFHAQQPWVLAKKNPELFAEVIAAVCHSLNAIATMLWPIMPSKMTSLLASLGKRLELGTNYEPILRENAWTQSFTLTKQDEPLFVRPETHVLVEEQPVAPVSAPAQPAVPEIGIEDFAKVQLVVGTILSCEPVKGSEKLYKLQVDLGKLGMRQILSGVAQRLKPEDLIGKQEVFVANLKPRKMMGLESHGMMLLADNGEYLRPIVVDGKIDNGSTVK